MRRQELPGSVQCIDELVARWRNSLGEDLISTLIRAEDEGDRLTHDELQRLAGAVLTAGTDTARNQLAAAVDVFCDHPDQWALLAEHPELAPSASPSRTSTWPGRRSRPARWSSR